MLSIEKENEREKVLPRVQFAINNVVNSRTNETASKLLMGYKPSAAVDARLTTEIQSHQQADPDIAATRDAVLEKSTL